MVDKVYKSKIAAYAKELQLLKEEFRTAGSTTDWIRLRVEPLLLHATRLEHLQRSRKFLREFSRLPQGVVLFHSDLVYLRTNIAALRKILAPRKRASRGKRRPGG